MRGRYQDHAFGAREMPKIQPSQVTNDLHVEALRSQGPGQRIVCIASHQQKPRPTNDLDPAFRDVIA
jgi:hypothetical protein